VRKATRREAEQDPRRGSHPEPLIKTKIGREAYLTGDRGRRFPERKRVTTSCRAGPLGRPLAAEKRGLLATNQTLHRIFVKWALNEG
jgi:hypothetical protein